MAKPHWTQTPEGKAKMADVQRKAWATKRKKKATFQKIAKAAIKSYGKGKKREKKATSLVVNGWRVTLGQNEIRIDHE